MKYLVHHLNSALRSRRCALLLLLALMGIGQAMGNSTTYYAKLTAKTSATGKGLVYAAASNTAPTADNQYKSSIDVTGNNSSRNSSASVSFYVWASPARGYLFDNWTGANAKTGNGDVVTIAASATDSKNSTTATVTANWKDAPSYTITYKQPENKGQYSVRYDYTQITNNAFTAGSESYTMSASSGDQAVKSYAADKVTLSTSLSSFIGWYEGETQLSTDKEYTYTVSKDATITARFEAPKEYQVSVTSDGATTQYKTIQEALAAANKLTTNPTVTLLDNITGVDEILTVSKSMTIDLNGYTLAGSGGRRVPTNASDLSKELLWVNGSKITVTIKDGSAAKTGTINCTDELNHDLYGIRVDNGTLNLESGTIHAENTEKYEGSTNRMRTYTVYAAPGCTLNQKGATIEAVGDYYAYGILTGGWYSDNGPAKVNVSGGTINASAFNSPRGIDAGYGDINVTGGEINATATGGNWSSYGISLNAGANAQKKNEWHATLTMSGGTVNASSTTSAARGIRVNRSVAYQSGSNTVASIVRAEATITGGTVNATTTTSWPVAVEPYGPTTISGGTITAKAGTSDAYGVRVMDGKTIINGNANITATAATNNAFGATAGADTDGSKGTAYEGDLQVDGGTITATATNGATARGIFVASASRQITNKASGYFPGYYAAAGKATVTNGKISATAKTNGAAAFYIAATSTNGSASATPTASISGGWFRASGTNAVSVNNLAGTKDLTIAGGCYQQSANVSDYVPSTQTIYALTGSINADAYNFGCRYYVTDWDYTKAIAKNTSTNKTYTSVKAALDEATSGQTVVIIENCKMNEQATVKSGVKLLVPYDTKNTFVTSDPNTTSTWKDVNAFMTLFMGENASLTVNNGGAICVGGQQFTTTNRMSTTVGGPCSPVGDLGVIDMSTGGSITLESGSNLYVYGYIKGQNVDEGNNTTGVGSILAKSGSTVYESFVIGDYQGGNATSGMAGDNNKNKYKVFPFNQYFIPNIEVPLTFEYGATEKTPLNMSSSGGLSADQIVTFISNANALFTMGTGAKMKKWYDATTDHLCLESWGGDVSISGIDLKVGSTSFSSKDYVLPFTGNFSYHAIDGNLRVPSAITLIPGSEIKIDENASATISSDTYVWDADNWDKYGYGYNRIYFPFRLTRHYGENLKWGGKTGLEDAKVEMNGTLNVAGKLYTTQANGHVSSAGYGRIVLQSNPTATSNTYVVVGNGQTETDYRMGSGATNFKSYYATQVPVTAAQLLNADGTYVATSGASANTTYYYDPNAGKWATTEPTYPSFTYDAERQALSLTNEVVVTAGKLKAAVASHTGENKQILSADLTNATGALDLAAMRSAIGADDGNNVLLYAPAAADASHINNVVVNGICPNFVLTDKQPIGVPTAFTATKASYSRANTGNAGDRQWGTICLPFEVTSDDNIQYYKLSVIDHAGGTMKFERVDKVEANQPAIYSVGENKDALPTITISGGNVAIEALAQQSVVAGGYTLTGVQDHVETLALNSNNYYIAQNKFWQPTKSSVAVRPQRAYFQGGAGSSAKEFAISISDDTVTGIGEAAEAPALTIIGIYSPNGTKLDDLQPGLNIVRYSDGTTRKLMVR